MSEQKYFIITGAAKRLGAEIARFLVLECNYNLILHYHQSHSEIQALQDELLKKNKNIKIKLIAENFLVNISSDSNSNLIQKALEYIPKKHIAGLINNASLFLRGSIADGQNFQNQMQVNALIAYHLISDYHRLIGQGDVINMLDSNVSNYSLEYQNYVISKKLLEEITKQSAIALAPHIRVNAIAPGPTLPLAHETQETFQTKVASNNILSKYQPSSNSITQSLHFILNNPFLTGQIIYLGGGAHLSNKTQAYR